MFLQLNILYNDLYVMLKYVFSSNVKVFMMFLMFTVFFPMVYCLLKCVKLLFGMFLLDNDINQEVTGGKKNKQLI